jgi:hypothetical protein
MLAYFMKPNHCAILTDEGQDVNDKTSGEIPPYGICALWEQLLSTIMTLGNFSQFN